MRSRGGEAGYGQRPAGTGDHPASYDSGHAKSEAIPGSDASRTRSLSQQPRPNGGHRVRKEAGVASGLLRNVPSFSLSHGAENLTRNDA